ncbi:NAD(P)-binding domain-containing protein [Pelagibacterales bacterium SAG-MED46]|nr:NAD(P)-binding domain-containing protein [Pelagibacterales bacterium SAG-MED46]
MIEKIAFIGVGNMGGPMAENLLKSGKEIKVFDVSNLMLEKAKEKGLEIVKNVKDLINKETSIVITMLPEGKHSKEIYLGDNGILNKVTKDCLLIDCILTFQTILHQQR